MVSVSRTTLGKVAAALVDAGLVARIRNPDDRRSYLLERTAEGAAEAVRERAVAIARRMGGSAAGQRRAGRAWSIASSSSGESCCSQVHEAMLLA